MHLRQREADAHAFLTFGLHMSTQTKAQTTTVSALEAAEIADRHRNTISNWLESGRLDAEKKESGEWAIPLEQVLRQRDLADFEAEVSERARARYQRRYEEEARELVQAAGEFIKAAHAYDEDDEKGASPVSGVWAELDQAFVDLRDQVRQFGSWRSAWGGIRTAEDAARQMRRDGSDE